MTVDPVVYYNHSHTAMLPNQTYQGYQCSNCGQWVYGHHNCYYYAQPMPTQIIVTNPIPTPGVDFNLNQQLQEVKEELKEVRNLLENLMDLAVNDHAEVRGCDEGRGEDPASDTGGSRQSSVRIDVTAEASRHLGL